MTRADPVIVLDQVSKRYGEGVTAVDALRDVGLEVGRGELVVVLGPSGSGKTTLLNVIGAIEPPTSGGVYVEGHDLSSLDDRARTRFRREVTGFVFQFFNLVPTLTARENVELVAELTGADAGRAAGVLADIGLGERADHFPAQLSGGEQQRVAIARALVKSPRLLLCDEPTGALDAKTGRTVLSVLRDLNRGGRTVVIVTHNADIGRIADRVVEMRSGSVERIRRHRSPAEVGSLRL